MALYPPKKKQRIRSHTTLFYSSSLSFLSSFVRLTEYDGDEEDCGECRHAVEHVRETLADQSLVLGVRHDGRRQQEAQSHAQLETQTHTRKKKEYNNTSRQTKNIILLVSYPIYYKISTYISN